MIFYASLRSGGAFGGGELCHSGLVGIPAIALEPTDNPVAHRAHLAAHLGIMPRPNSPFFFNYKMLFSFLFLFSPLGPFIGRIAGHLSYLHAKTHRPQSTAHVYE